MHFVLFIYKFNNSNLLQKYQSYVTKKKNIEDILLQHFPIFVVHDI